MMFIVTSLDRNQRPEDLAFQLATFEEGLDFVSKLAAKGETLLKVAIVDRHSLSHLPPEIFDGASFSQPMGRLATEWEAILAKPDAGPCKPDDWEERWIQQCELSIAQQEQSLINTCQLLDSVLASTQLEEAMKHRLAQQCRTILAMSEKQLERTYGLLAHFQQKLNP